MSGADLPGSEFVDQSVSGGVCVCPGVCLGVGVMRMHWGGVRVVRVYISQSVRWTCISQCWCWCLQVAVQTHLWHVFAGQ